MAGTRGERRRWGAGRENARCSGSEYLNDGLENGTMALAIGNRYEHELVEIKSADRPLLIAGRDIGPASLLCRGYKRVPCNADT